MADNTTNYLCYDSDRFVMNVPLPNEIYPESGDIAWRVSVRQLFLYLATLSGEEDFEATEMYREIAFDYPEVFPYSDYFVERDSGSKIQLDHDDWDDIADDLKERRANRNAAIAHADRILFDLEMIEDIPETQGDVTRIRRALAEVAFG